MKTLIQNELIHVNGGHLSIPMDNFDMTSIAIGVYSSLAALGISVLLLSYHWINSYVSNLGEAGAGGVQFGRF